MTERRNLREMRDNHPKQQKNDVPIVHLTDNSQCREVLLDAGKIDMLVEGAPDRNMSSLFFHYKGFYAMASLFYGFPDEADNGYTLTLLHTESFGKEEASRFFLDMLNRSIPDQNTMRWDIISEQLSENN